MVLMNVVESTQSSCVFPLAMKIVRAITKYFIVFISLCKSWRDAVIRRGTVSPEEQ
jgi:hypothetical protein